MQSGDADVQLQTDDLGATMPTNGHGPNGHGAEVEGSGPGDLKVGAAGDVTSGEHQSAGSLVQSDRNRLVLLSFLMLFVELGLIRWMGSKIVYLSFSTNFVLLGSFLGIGLGFLKANSQRDLFRWSPLALLGLVAFVSLLPAEIQRSERELVTFGAAPSGLPIWIVLPFVFLATAGVLMTIAHGVARTFSRFEPLEAYRLDILGSIAGIVVFSVLALFRAPPVVWGLVIALLLAVLLEPFNMRHGMRVAALVVVLAIDSFLPGVSWSPYYRVSTFKPDDLPSAIAVNVNGIPHQVAEPIADRLASFPLYGQPYSVGKPPPGNVLIIGAGTGNDVAAALANGAKHVDAVEIDPRIREIGGELHPDRPYADPRVEVQIDDGRAFVERTNKKYDAIILALPDSLVLVAGQAAVRLESYLFTREAMTSFKEHLTPTGTFTMYNLYRDTWLRDRYANTLAEVFGSSPCITTQGQAGTVAAMSVDLDNRLVCPTRWEAGADAVPPPATDDHPFPYLRESTIPTVYLLSIAAILAASLVLIRVVSGDGFKSMRPYTDLFAMGAAFLLLETKSVVQFALLFGTTWFVNALVFTGVLLSVYLAVELSIRVRISNRLLLYAALMASLALAWLVPVSSLLSLSAPVRFIAAITLAFAPIFLANLIFADRFREVGSSTSAFGANLLGAMVGGLLEYTALAVGYRSLLILVAILYAVAYALGRASWSRKMVPAALNSS